MPHFTLHEQNILSFLLWIHKLYPSPKDLLYSTFSIKDWIPIFLILYTSLYFHLSLLWFYSIRWTFPELLNSSLCLTSLTRPETKYNFPFMPYKFRMCSIIFVDGSYSIFSCLSNGRRGFFFLMEKIEQGHCEGAYKYYRYYPHTDRFTMLLKVAIKDPIQVYFSLNVNPIVISTSGVHSQLHCLYYAF